jgi:hypothetical protein
VAVDVIGAGDDEQRRPVHDSGGNNEDLVAAEVVRQIPVIRAVGPEPLT